MKYKALIFIIFLGCKSVYTQARIDSVQKLDEVILSDIKLKTYAQGYKVTTLKDSVFNKNGKTLTDLLRYNSHIYFRENGYGMVSSASFRGTNASHTAVIWNGININSQLNGQTDFNTIVSTNYNTINIRYGGGSVQYGSGAIGGSVHLNNTIEFTNKIAHQLQLSYGSFNTSNTSYHFNKSTHRFSANVGLAFINSDNNYRVLGTDKRNINGRFTNSDLNLGLGYIISESNVIKFHHQYFRGNRSLSPNIVIASAEEKYENDEFRTMVDWTNFGNKFTSTLKLAHVKEHYKYFENQNVDTYADGTADNWILKYHYKRLLSKTLKFSFISDYRYISANGDNFNNPNRSAFATTLIFGYKPNKKLHINANIRKDFISDFDSPLIFSTDLRYHITKSYTAICNASKNFRVPTFNDLYWMPGGNTNLVPETSYQFDLGHKLSLNRLQFLLNTFLIATKDLIQWLPDHQSGFWSPRNINATRHYGIEAEAQLKMPIYIKSNVMVTSAYSYTKAIDKEDNQPLIYVPIHKINTSIAYNYKLLTLYYQHLYNGKVHIIGDDILTGFDVGNLGVAYHLNKGKKVSYDFNLRINNLYNSYYENVSLRPMPPRNFNLFLTLNL